MDNECSICLQEMNNTYHKKDNIIKTLSCGHKFHYHCFRDMVYRKGNFFISCPLCRQINSDISKPYKDTIDNLECLCDTKSKKCMGYTKEGRRCKRHMNLLNYGYCYQHRPLTYIPWSRQNWKQLKIKIHTYFSNIESDFILLHKPFEVT